MNITMALRRNSTPAAPMVNSSGRQVQVVVGVHPLRSPFLEPDMERGGRMALTEVAGVGAVGQPGRHVDGVVPGVDAGVGHRGGVAAGGEALDGEFALGLAAVEALPVGQHHRAEGRGDQQRAGQFERPQVADEDQRGEALDVAARVGLGRAR